MTYEAYCPPLKLNKAHAKNLQNSTGISLGMAQKIVACFYECSKWSELKKKCDKHFKSSSMRIPIYYLRHREIELFQLLVKNYHNELSIELRLQSKVILPTSLLSLVVNKNFNAIEHYQIDQVLNIYEEYGGGWTSFKRALELSDNTAKRIIDSLLSWRSARRPVSLWLRSSSFQQNIYACCRFNDVDDFSDNIVFIEVEEWYMDIKIPCSELSVVSVNWYVNYMAGYIEMLTEQFRQLGYKPVFKFFKIQNVYLSSLTSSQEDKKHPNHGIFKLAKRLGFMIKTHTISAMIKS